MSAFTEANRKAFDDLSATYNSKPWQLTLAHQIATVLQTRLAWLGISPSNAPSTRFRLLDYACGTGTVTRALGPHATQIRGIDISPNMVAKYNETALSSGLDDTHTRAVVADLCSETPNSELSGQEWHNFDLAAISLGFHHFEFPSLSLARLRERLRPEKGVLVIIDFLPFDHSRDEGKEGFKAMKHTIKHNGFTEAQMRELYTDNGFEDVEFVTPLEEPVVMELESGTVRRTLFIAKGRRGA